MLVDTTKLSLGEEQTVASCFWHLPACSLGRAGAIGQAEEDQPDARCRHGAGAGKAALENEAVPIGTLDRLK